MLNFIKKLFGFEKQTRVTVHVKTFEPESNLTKAAAKSTGRAKK